MHISFIQTFSNIQSFTCIKDSSSTPGLSNGGFILLPGSWSRPSVNWPKQQWFQQQAPALDVPAILPSSHTALLIWRSFPFYKGSAHHHSILQTVKTRDKTLEGLSKRQPADRGGKPHLLCPTPSEPRIYQFPGLSRATSHSQCNS